MKDTRHRTRVGSLFRFAVRGLGLLGVLAAVNGLGITAIERPDVFAVRSVGQVEPTVRPLVEGAAGTLPQVGAILLLAGAAAVLVWLLVELLGGLFLVAGRKSAAGVGATAQVALAAALLVVVNALSFQHFARFDRTRDRRFTLDPPLVEQLKKLDPNSPTTVLVLQMDRTSALEPEQSDALTTAAQQKITEKVLDLIDELREQPDLTARFDVHVLHTKDEAFADRLAAVTAGKPELTAAVEAAQENSILFAANGRVRRMPFAQFYLLDRPASQGKATADDRPNPAAANLVLAPQGKDRFVRALLGVEAKKPRVGLAVIHPLLSSRESNDDYSAGGLRQALLANGFEVSDVILKKGWGRREPTPAASTFEEDELARTEGRYNLYSLLVYDRERAVQLLNKEKERVAKAPLADVDREFRRAVGRPIRTEEDRGELMRDVIDYTIRLRADELAEFRTRLEKETPKYQQLIGDDRLLDTRRETNVKTKLAQYAADCDLLIVPRYTVMDVSKGAAIPARLYTLAADQAEVVKEFLKAGKPVLFAFGPTNADRARPGLDPAADDLEKMVARFGIELGGQTVVTEDEAQAISEQQGEALQQDTKLPPLVFPPAPADGTPANPIAAAFARTARSVGSGVEVKRSGFRPVYAPAVRQPFPPAVMLTTAASWNESRPLAEDDYIPTFDPPKPNDPKKGTRDEERKGPFPVGVAVEAAVPAEWVAADTAGGANAAAAVAANPIGAGLPPGVASAVALTPNEFAPDLKRPTVRLAVYGHGGLFVGKKLDPGQEALLLTTVNWQLNQADRLPKDVPDAERWRFPRVPLTENEQRYWKLGAAVDLPLLAAFFGLIALMLRRLR
jgi:hypothetical protein